MLKRYLNTLKMGYTRAFDCYGKDSKMQYFCILSFQLIWFLFYLWMPYKSSFAILVFLIFFLPVISSNTRCVNYCGYPRSLCLIWLIAPYIMLFLPFFLKKKKTIAH